LDIEIEYVPLKLSHTTRRACSFQCVYAVVREAEKGDMIRVVFVQGSEAIFFDYLLRLVNGGVMTADEDVTRALKDITETPELATQPDFDGQFDVGITDDFDPVIFASRIFPSVLQAELYKP